MARSRTAIELATLVKRLHQERQEYVDAIAQIDKMFGDLGIETDASSLKSRRKGKRKASKKRAKRKTRKSFRQTAEEFVVGLLKRSKSMTTGQINSRWSQAGRGGNADNALSKLTQAKRVKRKNIKGARGSTYSRK